MDEVKDFVAPGTAPRDGRFPYTNQAKYCWFSYVEYHLCMKKNKMDFATCGKFKKNYRAICPDAWTELWDEQRKEGLFAGPEWMNDK